MKKKFGMLARGVLLAACALTLAACAGGSAPPTTAPNPAPIQAATHVPPTVAPPTATVQPTTAPPIATAAATSSPPPQPTALAPTDTLAASAQSGYDGTWGGKSSTDSPIEFTIEQNQITSATVNFTYNSGGCSVGTGYGFNPTNGQVNGKEFAVQGTDSDGVVYSLAGSFTSGTDAGGTLEVKGKTFCGDTDAKATWTAKNTSNAASSSDTVTPSGVAAQGTTTIQSNGGPVENVFAEFFLDLDTKNVDDAMALVSDQVVFHIGLTSGVGKDKLKAYMQDQVNKGVVYVGSNVSVIGTIVQFSVNATDASGTVLATYPTSMFVVAGGKISILTLK